MLILNIIIKNIKPHSEYDEAGGFPVVASRRDTDLEAFSRVVIHRTAGSHQVQIVSSSILKTGINYNCSLDRGSRSPGLLFSKLALDHEKMHKCTVLPRL